MGMVVTMAITMDLAITMVSATTALLTVDTTTQLALVALVGTLSITPKMFALVTMMVKDVSITFLNSQLFTEDSMVVNFSPAFP